MKKLKLVIILAIFAFAGNAYARYDLSSAVPVVKLKPFLDVGAGFSIYGFSDNDCDNDDTTTNNSLFNKSSARGDFSYSATMGMNIMQYLSVLTRYTNYGQAKDSAGTKLTANSLALMVRGILPLDVVLPVKTHISLFIDLGYANLNYKFDTPSNDAQASEADSKSAFAYNFGAGYSINSNLQVSLQYGFNATDNVNNENFLASILSTNVSYYF